MNKSEALNMLVELAYGCELPKGTTGKQASQHIQAIQKAENILKSLLKDDK
jgi:hypothetical protein